MYIPSDREETGLQMYTYIFNIDRFKLEMKMRQLKHPAITSQNPVLFLPRVKSSLCETRDKK